MRQSLNYNAKSAMKFYCLSNIKLYVKYKLKNVKFRPKVDCSVYTLNIIQNLKIEN